jgi:hypothetical protein
MQLQTSAQKIELGREQFLFLKRLSIKELTKEPFSKSEMLQLDWLLEEAGSALLREEMGIDCEMLAAYGRLAHAEEAASGISEKTTRAETTRPLFSETGSLMKEPALEFFGPPTRYESYLRELEQDSNPRTRAFGAAMRRGDQLGGGRRLDGPTRGQRISSTMLFKNNRTVAMTPKERAFRWRCYHVPMVRKKLPEEKIAMKAARNKRYKEKKKTGKGQSVPGMCLATQPVPTSAATTPLNAQELPPP